MKITKTFKAKELGELFYYALYNCSAIWKASNVNDKTQKEIKLKFNINVNGFSIILHSNYLKHFLYRHFDEKDPKQRDITFKDIQKIADVINNHTAILKGNKPDTILFKQQRPDGLFELVCFIDSRNKTLSGRSFRIKA